MNVFGNFLGYLLPGIFINSYSDISQLNDDTRPVYEKQVFNMMLAISIFATVVAILIILTFREKPGAPLFAKATEDYDNLTW